MRSPFENYGNCCALAGIAFCFIPLLRRDGLDWIDALDAVVLIAFLACSFALMPAVRRRAAELELENLPTLYRWHVLSIFAFFASLALGAAVGRLFAPDLRFSAMSGLIGLIALSLTVIMVWKIERAKTEQ